MESFINGARKEQVLISEGQPEKPEPQDEEGKKQSMLMNDNEEIGNVWSLSKWWGGLEWQVDMVIEMHLIVKDDKQYLQRESWVKIRILQMWRFDYYII